MGYRGSIGIIEKTMETIEMGLDWGYIGIMENGNYYNFRGYIGVDFCCEWVCMDRLIVARG